MISSFAEKPLGETLELLTDGTHHSPKSKTGPFKYITSKNVRMGKLDLADIAFISEEEHRPIYSRCPVVFGDVLLTKDGASTGNVALNTINEEFSLLSSVALLRPKKEILDARFLMQFLASALGQHRLISEMSGQAITRLTLQTIAGVKIPVPSLMEQQKIIEILSDCDTAIELCSSRLLSEEESYSALASQLFKGLENNIGTKPLSEICHIGTGKKDVNEGNPDGEYPFFTCSKQHTFSDTYSYDMEAILLAGNGEIGNPKYFTGKFEAYQRTYILSNFNGIIPQLLTTFLDIELKRIVERERQDSAMSYIKKGTLEKIQVPLWDGERQQKLASYFLLQQERVKIIQNQLILLKKQKRGLMQQLLTGKLRVKGAA